MNLHNGCFHAVDSQGKEGTYASWERAPRERPQHGSVHLDLRGYVSSDRGDAAAFRGKKRVLQPSGACKETPRRRAATKFISPGKSGVPGVGGGRALFVSARGAGRVLSFVAYLSSFALFHAFHKSVN